MLMPAENCFAELASASKLCTVWAALARASRYSSANRSSHSATSGRRWGRRAGPEAHRPDVNAPLAKGQERRRSV